MPESARPGREWTKRWRAWWHRSGRPRWRASRPTLWLVLAALAFSLGIIGYLDLPNEHYNVIDASYRSVQLFALGGAVEPPVPWELQVARILAPLLVGYAAIRGILSLFRDQAQLWWIRTTFRDHVVIAGLSEGGARLALAFAAAGARVVVLEADPNSRLLGGSRSRGLRVLIGDASDPLILLNARADRARYLIAICGDDGANVDVAMAASRVAHERHHGVLSAFVHIGSPALWRALKAQVLATADEPEFRLECFNVPVTAARMLLERYPPFDSEEAKGQTRPHVCVIGDGEFAQQLVIRAASLWWFERSVAEPLRMTIAGPQATEVQRSLVNRYPELERLVEMDARPAELERLAPVLADIADPGSTRLYVALENESDTLAAALGVHGSPETQSLKIVVAVADEHGGLAGTLRSQTRSAGGPLVPFGILDAALSPELVLRGVNELLARAKHESYATAESAKDTGAPLPNRSLLRWDELPESLKESNRRFADGIAAALDEAGCVIVPAPLASPGEDGFAFTPEDVEQLARREHERWTRDLARDGWRLTAGEKDAERKLHPLLVPWNELDEEERQKDREAVRAIPLLLRRVGFDLYRPVGSQPHRSEESDAVSSLSVDLP